jgi:hypothetical protein
VSLEGSACGVPAPPRKSVSTYVDGVPLSKESTAAGFKQSTTLPRSFHQTTVIAFACLTFGESLAKLNKLVAASLNIGVHMPRILLVNPVLRPGWAPEDVRLRGLLEGCSCSCSCHQPPTEQLEIQSCGSVRIASHRPRLPLNASNINLTSTKTQRDSHYSTNSSRSPTSLSLPQPACRDR